MSFGWPIKNSILMNNSLSISEIEDKISDYLCKRFDGKYVKDNNFYESSINYREFSVRFREKSPKDEKFKVKIHNLLFRKEEEIRVKINQPQRNSYTIDLLCKMIYDRDKDKYIPEGFNHSGSESEVEKDIKELFL